MADSQPTESVPDKPAAATGTLGPSQPVQTSVETDDGYLRSRKNGKTTGIRATDEEIEERVELVIWCLANQWKKGAIIRQIREKYGVCRRTVVNYIACARKQMLKRAEITKEDLTSECLSGYEAIIADPASSPADKNRALDSIRDMFGIKKPVQVDMTSKGEAIEFVVKLRPDEVP